MKVVIVVGARPNFMKAAPIIAAIRRHNECVAGTAVTARMSGAWIEHILVHTGQHYDALMSDAFFTDLDLPPPDFHLGVGAASPISQIAEILKRFEAVLLDKKPDAVVVVGDVNSTVAAALSAVKISLDADGSRPLLAHVEAGLRSFDRSMPEEINRVLTDHVSDLLFVTEPSGLQNLVREGISRERMHFVGNTMIDSVMAFKDKADDTGVLERLGLRAALGGANGHGRAGRYALLTLHRPSNVDNRETFQNVLAGLEELAAECPVVFPIHPRTKERIKSFGLLPDSGIAGSGETSCGIMMIEPLGYLEFLCLMKHAAIVITDSGGIQEETTCLGVPCVTARENTERPVTTEAGTNIVAGTSKHKIQSAIRRQLAQKPNGTAPNKWDGQAAGRIVEILLAAHCKREAAELEMTTGAGGQR
jgi:UDP-N-acetylglucosamine 2-epimerase (non-hydrolysing)